MVGVGRDLCGSSSPTLLPKQGHLQQAVLNISREGDSTTSLGSLCQCSVTLTEKKFFLKEEQWSKTASKYQATFPDISQENIKSSLAKKVTRKPPLAESSPGNTHRGARLLRRTGSAGQLQTCCPTLTLQQLHEGANDYWDAQMSSSRLNETCWWSYHSLKDFFHPLFRHQSTGRQGWSASPLLPSSPNKHRRLC